MFTTNSITIPRNSISLPLVTKVKLCKVQENKRRFQAHHKVNYYR